MSEEHEIRKGMWAGLRQADLLGCTHAAEDFREALGLNAFTDPAPQPAAPTAQEAVQALDWVDLGDSKSFRALLPIIGSVRVEPYGCCGWWEVLWSMPGQCDKLIPDVFDKPDDAKAAAQADYDRRILAVLTPAPQPAASVDREALVDLIAKARGHFTPGEMAWAGNGYHKEDEQIAHVLIAAGYVRDPQPEPKVCPFGDECDLTVAYMAGAASKYAVRYPTEPAGDKVEALVKAAQAVVDRWDSIDWKAPPTAEVMNQLRAALASIGGQNNG